MLWCDTLPIDGTVARAAAIASTRLDVVADCIVSAPG